MKKKKERKKKKNKKKYRKKKIRRRKDTTKIENMSIEFAIERRDSHPRKY